MLTWIGDDFPKVAVAKGEKGPTIYAVDEQGRLLIQGPDWKEPWDRKRNQKQFADRGFDVWTYAAKIGTPESAMRVAELIQTKYIEPTLTKSQRCGMM